MAQLNVSIPSALKAWIDTRVDQGRYSSASDYIRDLVRRDQDEEPDQRAWLLAELEKGLASPILDRDGFQVLDDVVAEGRMLHAKAGSQS
jgi:antitoxin ParD1/3/4